MEHSASASAWEATPWRAVQRAAFAAVAASEPELHAILFPHIRVELPLRTKLTRQWDDDAWPLVRQEIQKALKLRSLLRKAGWWN